MKTDSKAPLANGASPQFTATRSTEHEASRCPDAGGCCAYHASMPARLKNDVIDALLSISENNQELAIALNQLVLQLWPEMPKV